MAFEIENGILKKYVEEDGITEILIPDGITEIKNEAFRKCSNLKSIIIPNSVTKIGSYAFSGCSNLKNIKMPNKIEIIECGVFLNALVWKILKFQIAL